MRYKSEDSYQQVTKVNRNCDGSVMVNLSLYWYKRQAIASSCFLYSLFFSLCAFYINNKMIVDWSSLSSWWTSEETRLDFVWNCRTALIRYFILIWFVIVSIALIFSLIYCLSIRSYCLVRVFKKELNIKLLSYQSCALWVISFCLDCELCRMNMITFCIPVIGCKAFAATWIISVFSS